MAAAEGQSGREIADALGLSEGSARNFLSEPISTVGGRNRIDAGPSHSRRAGSERIGHDRRISSG
jgi:DNA-binding NarL/FixJ family response regulator